MIETIDEVILRIFPSGSIGLKSGNIYPASIEDVKKCMRIWAEVQREVDAQNDMKAIEDRMGYNFYAEDEDERSKCRVCYSTDLNEIGNTSKGIQHFHRRVGGS